MTGLTITANSSGIANANAVATQLQAANPNVLVDVVSNPTYTAPAGSNNSTPGDFNLQLLLQRHYRHNKLL